MFEGYVEDDYNWVPDWSKDICAIYGSGPSLKNPPQHPKLKHVKSIAINRAHEVLPPVDVVYGCDHRFWEEHYFAGHQAKGNPLLVTQYHKSDPRRRLLDKGLRYLPLCMGAEFKLDFPVLGAGSNSGFQALNFAYHTGCQKILLFGFDMRHTAELHFHGPHKNLHNPATSSFPTWRQAFEGARPWLIKAGVQVYNCTPKTGLDTFKKTTVGEALEGFDGV